MNRKRILVFGIVLVALCALIWLQVRTWKKFDWAMFWSRTEHVNWLYILAGLAFTYLAYVLRAVRWRIFLKPVHKTTTARLLAPQFVGFAALALLGRAGEMIRPYIIAKKERLTFTSQMAVWGVERIFDMASFAIMLAVSFFSPDLRTLSFYSRLREASFFLTGLIVVLIIGLVIVRLSGDRVANFLYARTKGFAPKLAHHLREKTRSFSHGLQTIQDIGSALQLVVVSLFMWVLIAFAYYAVTHAYPGELERLTMPFEIVLMGSSMVGSMLQLPAVGGGSQLATISMLSAGFGIEHELAVSCGMMLWAVTFMSVIPTGLAIARHEHVSIRAVAEAEEQAAALQK
jgi:glycosyltransferase 2 family protein